MQQTVWVVGDWQREEFADAIDWLEGAARCHFYSHMDSASPRENDCPTAILFVQSRPAQISRGDIERFSAAEPLARLVALVGAWCEGEERSGRPWPGVMRVPVAAWQGRLSRELGLERDDERTARLPRTATAAERIEVGLRAGMFPSRAWERFEQGSGRVQPGVAAVYAGSKSRFDAISDMLRLIGLDAIWCDGRSPLAEMPNLTVIDGWEQASMIVPLPDQSEPPPRVLLLHFPRDEDYVRAKMQRIDAVVPLPLLLGNLANALDKITSCASGPRALTATPRHN
jgi:hypothetical protein